MKFTKIISLITVIIPILELIIFNIFFRKNIMLAEENTVNYIVLILIECINILIYMLLHKFNIPKSGIICIGIYLMISALIPVYRISETYTPTGPNSHLMGLGLKIDYVDIYGINITSIIDSFI